MSFIRKHHSTESGEILAELKNLLAPESDRASTGEVRSSMPKRADAEVLSLSEQIRFLNRTYQELDVALDPNKKCIWCYAAERPPKFHAEHGSRTECAPSFHSRSGRPPRVGRRAPGSYYVQASQIPGIYNIGGDLSFLANRIRDHDREAIRRYAYGCVHAVYNIAVGFDSGIVSVGLLQGDTLGGGLEGALCCNFIVAERGVKIGLPEILFNLFPGMGAYSMLCRRLDSIRVKRMIFS